MSWLRGLLLVAAVAVWCPGPASAEEDVDVSADRETRTKIMVRKGDVIEVTARGRWRMGGFIGTCGASGFAPGTYQNYNIEPSFNHGCLMVRIGSGLWENVGNQNTIRARRDGALAFSPNDNDQSNNGGSLRVVVSVNGR